MRTDERVVRHIVVKQRQLTKLPNQHELQRLADERCAPQRRCSASAAGHRTDSRHAALPRRAGTLTGWHSSVAGFGGAASLRQPPPLCLPAHSGARVPTLNGPSRTSQLQRPAAGAAGGGAGAAAARGGGGERAAPHLKGQGVVGVQPSRSPHKRTSRRTVTTTHGALPLCSVWPRLAGCG